MTTPPGWYPDPSDPSAIRWWDGQAWAPPQTPTPAEASVAPPGGTPAYGAPQATPGFGVPPAAPGYPPMPAYPGGAPGYGGMPGYPGAPVPGQPASNGLAWVIALTPVIGIVFAAIGAATDSFALAVVGFPLYWLVSLVLAFPDARSQRAEGWQAASPAWALIGPWPYLLARTLRRRKQTAAPGWPLFIAAIVLSVAAGLTLNFTNPALNGSARYDQASLEAQIHTGLLQQTGQDLTISCPRSERLLEGRTFTCTATNGTTEQNVLVTVKKDGGTFRYEYSL